MKNILYLLFVYMLLPLEAYAHGFGERIDLPIPLNIYLIGAGVAVAVSFILMGFIGKKEIGDDTYPRYNLFKVRWIKKVLEDRFFLGSIQAFFVLVLLLVITAGFIGRQNSAFNIAPTVIWILFGVGMTYTVISIGNLWRVINPWRTLFVWLERIIPDVSLKKSWPVVLGVWPAFVLFFGYRWVENVFPNAANPSTLSLLIVLYSFITLGGMMYFGKVNWLRYGDPFSVFFRFLSYFSLTERRVIENRKELLVRPPGIGLLKRVRIGASEMTFVLFMISSVTFDGMLSIPLWQSIYRTLFKLGVPSLLIGTIGLLLLLLIFLGVYLFFSFLVKIYARTRKSSLEVAYAFVLSLLPIAIAYELAHFMSLILIEGQRIFYLVSDPFGFG
ncbi:MAG: hypothetical protein WD153_01255 [Candidatus Paceibacterota bacterium]